MTKTIKTIEPIPPIQSRLGDDFFVFAGTNHGATQAEVFSFLRCMSIEQDAMTAILPNLLNAGQAEAQGLAEHFNPRFGALLAMKHVLELSEEWHAIRDKMTPIFTEWCKHRDAEIARKAAEDRELGDAQRAVAAAEEAHRLAMDNDPKLCAARAKVDTIAAARAAA